MRVRSGGRSIGGGAVTLLSALSLVAFGPRAARTQAVPDSAMPSRAALAALADSVAGRGSTVERTRRLVHWINDAFTWSATDYVKRTPEQVIARRSGNCAELASVLHTFLDALALRSRWVHEINVQPAPTPRRQATAEQMVAARGNTYSVFGLQHNDHVWLEVWDDASGSWFPADAAYGVVGMSEWLPARLAMERRPLPRVAAVEPIAADMLVPFVVVVSAQRNGPYLEDRTSYYLIDGFDRLYGGQLTSLPAWSAWATQVRALSAHAIGALRGQENLHQHTQEIAQLKATYDALTAQANARKLEHVTGA